MIQNAYEQKLEQYIGRFFNVRKEYLAVTTKQFGQEFEAIIKLKDVEDSALKTILLFLRNPTDNPVPYLLIANYIKFLMKENELLINDNVIVILRRLMDAHSNFNLNDEIVEPVYLEILSKLLKYNSFSIIRAGNTFKFNLRLIKVIKFFEDKSKAINSLSPREWTKEFYRFNVEYLARNFISQTITKFHNAMVPFEEIFPGISQEFLSIQTFYRLKNS